MRFSKQEYWIGLPFPPPRALTYPGIESASPGAPALAGRYLPEPPVKPLENDIGGQTWTQLVKPKKAKGSGSLIFHYMSLPA